MSAGPYKVVYNPNTQMHYVVGPGIQDSGTIFGKRSIAEHAASVANVAYAMGRKDKTKGGAE